MAWLSFVALATALSLGLAWVARRGTRRLWQAVGIVFLLLVVTLFDRGGIGYQIGCGMDCGGVALVDPVIVLFDAVLIAIILSVPQRVSRYPIRVAAATVISIAILTLTVTVVIA